MTVEEAQAAIRKAEAARDAAKEALRAAEIELDNAKAALQAAKLEADSRLPKARVVLLSRCVEHGAGVQVVITKRTAKQVTVRRPGQGGGGWTFRLGDSGRWMQHPRPEHWDSSTATLEIDE